MNNTINLYSNFYKNTIKNLCSNFTKLAIMDDFINTYINCLFFHKLETLDFVKSYNFSTIKKELNGKYFEIIYEGKASREDSMFCYKVICFLINILDNEMVNKNTFNKTLEEFFNDNNIDLSNINFEKIYNDVCSFHEKLEKFKNKLTFKEFNLISNKLNEYSNYYRVDCNINSLSKYSDSLIEEGYKDNNVKFNINLLTFNMVNLEMISLIDRRCHIHNYFIDFNIFDNKKNEILLNTIYHDLRHNITLVIDSNDYDSNKVFVKKLGNLFNLSVKVSLGINPIKKLDSLDSNNIFKSIIITDYKDSDYNDVLKYKSKNEKQIFIIERED